jgi:FKBP-type peptidyl-prolyl cis-trans isomerase FklB
MRTFLMVFFVAALAGSLVIGAQPVGKKSGGASSKPDTEVAGAPDDGTDAVDRDDTPAKDEDEPSKDEDKGKAPKKDGKKVTGIKLKTDDSAELLKVLSYMTGYQRGHEIHRQFEELGVDFDIDELVASFRAGLEGKEPTMTQEEMQIAAPKIKAFIDEKRAAKLKEEAAANKEEGDDFLAANKKKEGVKTLPSGLQYKILKSGKGETPKKTDTVKFHYKGTLVSGAEFESSYKIGAPAQSPVGKLVPGMAEALQLMKVGDKWQLVIPPELAYGFQGMPPVIPPSATLVFEVELLGVDKGGKLPGKLPGLK